MEELYPYDYGKGEQQGCCMGVEETLMAVQQPVENRSYAYGEQVYHEERKQPSTQSQLGCVEIGEEGEQRLAIEIRHQYQGQKYDCLVGAQQGKKTFGRFGVVTLHKTAEIWDNGGVNRPLCKNLAEVIGDVEGEVNDIGNATGSEDGAYDPCPYNAEHPTDKGAYHDYYAASGRSLILSRILQGNPS